MNKRYNYHKPNFWERIKYDTEGDFYPLFCIIVYGGKKIPIYQDDYGQQFYMKYNGNEFSGGGYSSLEDCLKYFINIIQNHIEHYYF